MGKKLIEGVRKRNIICLFLHSFEMQNLESFEVHQEKLLLENTKNHHPF